MVLWDFLNKRFFLHLDAEHGVMCAHLKSDLIKYYLIYCVKQKNKEKILEFFHNYSYEILSESSPLTSGNLRHWYTLPYIDEPERDNEFSVYFSTRWMELLRITLHNFLTIVFATASPPKLLLLEKWFRTEKQLELRAQLKLLNDKMELIISRFEKYEDRLQNLRDVVRLLSGYIQNNLHMQQYSSKASLNVVQAPTTAAAAAPVSGLFEADRDEDFVLTNSSSAQTNLKKADQLKSKDLEQSVLKLSAECARKSAILGNMSKDQRMKEILGEIYLLNPNGQEFSDPYSVGSSALQSLSNHPTSASYVSSQKELEELEAEMVTKAQDWINLLRNDHS